MIVLGTPSFATPAQEIERAVFASGVSDISQARAKQFERAFSAVALRIPQRDLPAYVTAAIDLRPDLAAKIVTAAVKIGVRRSESKRTALCEIVDRIVRAAIAANPDSVLAIGRAAIETHPSLRHCVASTVIAAAREQGFPISNHADLSFAIMSVAVPDSALLSSASFGTGTINPANLSDRESAGVNSPEQPPTD